ncbi:hypothetical protein [Pseudoramibacter porci]|uniref:Uncharacterized protein n=1 Tax=Pseudoramibacter porci TaxID=2606631 RepID=A0A7X2NFY9_9FIRM|nr:hypothetical protein [Pseudoramibacter porci]MSS19909.1 hypothetical protein [Pseudoramibacter porci]
MSCFPLMEEQDFFVYYLYIVVRIEVIIIKATKKQIQAMKNLYQKSDVEALEKMIKLHWEKIKEIVNSDGDSTELANNVVMLFHLVFNERMHMLSTFDPKAYERAVNDVQDKKITQRDFSKLVFKNLDSAKQNFAFGQTYNSMDRLVSNTIKDIRVFMHKYPQYEESIRAIWQSEH